MEGKTKRNDLLFDKLSFEIVGSAFEIQNELGSGLLEKTYYKALAQEFTRRGIKFEQQVYFPVKYKGEIVGRRYFDFLVEGKIVVELKCEKNFSRSTIKQVFDYLVSSDLQLGIILNFNSEGVRQKRIVNLPDLKIQKQPNSYISKN